MAAVLDEAFGVEGGVLGGDGVGFGEEAFVPLFALFAEIPCLEEVDYA